MITKTLSEDSDIDVGIWKSDIYGSLDGLDVSTDGRDIPLQAIETKVASYSASGSISK